MILFVGGGGPLDQIPRAPVHAVMDFSQGSATFRSPPPLSSQTLRQVLHLERFEGREVAAETCELQKSKCKLQLAWAGVRY